MGKNLYLPDYGIDCSGVFPAINFSKVFQAFLKSLFIN